MMTDERLAELVCEAGEWLAEHPGDHDREFSVWTIQQSESKVLELCAAVRLYKSKLEQLLGLAEDWSEYSGWDIIETTYAEAMRDAAGYVRGVIGELE